MKSKLKRNMDLESFINKDLSITNEHPKVKITKLEHKVK